MDEKGVTRKDRLAEFHFVRTHEIADFSGVLGVEHHDDAGHLRHGLDLQHAGHDRMIGKVALEERLVDRDRLHSGAFGITLEGHDAVDHEERIPVGENLHDLRGGKDALADWQRGRRDHRHHVGVLFGDGYGQFGVRSVTGPHGNDMTEQGTSGQGEISDDIEDLVADKFVREAEGFFAQDRVVADDDRVFQTPAADETFFHERLDILVVDEGARGSDFLLVSLGGDFEA